MCGPDKSIDMAAKRTRSLDNAEILKLDITELRERRAHDGRLTWFVGGLKQKGIIHYGLSANRQNPFAGAAHDAVFNVWRRTSGQLLFWVPPVLAGYYLMEWAIQKWVPSPVLQIAGWPVQS